MSLGLGHGRCAAVTLRYARRAARGCERQTPPNAISPAKATLFPVGPVCRVVGDRGIGGAGTPALMKLIITFPLERYDIATAGTKIPLKGPAASLAMLLYDRGWKRSRRPPGGALNSLTVHDRRTNCGVVA
jgi:hypothetical protein